LTKFDAHRGDNSGIGWAATTRFTQLSFRTADLTCRRRYFANRRLRRAFRNSIGYAVACKTCSESSQWSYAPPNLADGRYQFFRDLAEDCRPQNANFGAANAGVTANQQEQSELCA
jgi:hypothetical protein